MHRLRILFAIPALDRGGPDRVMFEILSRIDRTRFEPMLMVNDPEGQYLRKLPSDIPVTVLGKEHSLATRYPVLRAAKTIRKLRPDLVFSTLRMNATLGLAAPVMRKTRLIVRQANDFTADFDLLVKRSMLKHRVARWLSIATLRQADAIVCQSEAMRTDLRSVLGRADLHVIGNPVDIADVDRAATAAAASRRGSPALVSAGRLMPQKGYDILLRAVAILREQHPALHVTIYGDGPDRASLAQLRDELKLESHVTFAGFSDHVVAHVKAADLFVLASRYEGFPNAALEALACGTPVVLTDCPGANSELVHAGINGQLAAAVEPTAFATALDRAIRELPAYDRARIQADCRDRYSAERIIGAYEQVFAAVASA